MERKLLVAFYKATSESILSYCISVWYDGCLAVGKKALQRVVEMAEKNHNNKRTADNHLIRSHQFELQGLKVRFTTIEKGSYKFQHLKKVGQKYYVSNG
ncbi:hypothetical protein P4O66_003021 [Electrophorus voltai]|uniref:Uncharacterized protein n=1 Tax=Electrophorus voltai TaxID=2609070 RepID=A0AAD8YVR4_9TELE|nr:hypothetical protein P4O66_003021 [Electrophorus voltai]